MKEGIERLELEITKNEDLLARIMAQLEKATYDNDQQKLTDYTHAVGKLNQIIEELFEQLSEQTEGLEKLQTHYENEFATLDQK